MNALSVSFLGQIAASQFAELTLSTIWNWITTVDVTSLDLWVWLVVSFPASLIGCWLSVRYIPHTRVGVVELLWSSKGSVREGRIIALNQEAGYQAELLRGGIHLGYWRWQYRVHKVKLVIIPQGEIGYVYARDGAPLEPGQTLGRETQCNFFQDARSFLIPDSDEIRGQRGRQRTIIREGAYAINPALFVVITNNHVFSLTAIQDSQELAAIQHWQKELRQIQGFQPVIVGEMVNSGPLNSEAGSQVDSIAIVTIHDGPCLPPGEIIAPPVGSESDPTVFHNNFQDPEAFLRAGGRRGRQYHALTDGTYFINRWFATIETLPKTVVPIGYVGVIVSYYGKAGLDVSGTAFRHGERVTEGERGVWERPLGPGKYAFNTYAGEIVLVPTTNFVLHWITGRSETHRYDESLRSIELVTRDAYEPSLPLSVVVHIDYQRAASVIQRFGDVKKLITQTLDPLLSAYFRDIAHKKTMLELLHQRDVIQNEARAELRRRFHEFDIECVDVLIGKPDTLEAGGKIETLLEQLRLRQLSIEQVETFDRQREATERLRMLNEVKAQAEMQAQLTHAKLGVQISESKGDADVALARRQNERNLLEAETSLKSNRIQVQIAECQGEAELAKARHQAQQTIVLAEAECQQRILHGRGDSQRLLRIGLAEATALLRKVQAYGDSRLFVLSQVSKELANASQPLVPERLFISGENPSDGHVVGQGLLGQLISLLVAEKSGLGLTTPTGIMELEEIATKLGQEVGVEAGNPQEAS